MENAPQEQSTIKARFLNFCRSNSSPHGIASGMAVGVFIGITPLYGFHIIMAVMAALTLKNLNKVAIFLGMNISLPPTIPFITWAGYSMGRKILGSAYPVLGWEAFRHFSYSKFFHLFYALLVGSFVLGTGVSILLYFVILCLLKRLKKEDRISKRGS